MDRMEMLLNEMDCSWSSFHLHTSALWPYGHTGTTREIYRAVGAEVCQNGEVLNHDMGVKTWQAEKSFLNSYAETGRVGETATTMLVLLLFRLPGVLGAGSL